MRGSHTAAGPTRVRKRPVVVEAFHYDGTNAPEIVAWAGPAASYREGELVISTLEGDHVAEVGDYVMRGTRGEFYPIRPQVFGDVYEVDG